MENFLTNTTSLIGIIASIFGTYKLLSEVLNNRTLRLKEEIEITQKLINACESSDHPLAIEKLFNSIFQKPLDSRTIVFFINNWPNPTSAIKQFWECRDYVSYNHESVIIEYQKKWSKKNKRRNYLTLHLGTYFLCSFLALSPFFLSLSTIKVETKPLLTIAVFSLSLGLCAFLSAKEVWKIRGGDYLVTEYEKIKKESNNQINRTEDTSAT